VQHVLVNILIAVAVAASAVYMFALEARLFSSARARIRFWEGVVYAGFLTGGLLAWMEGSVIAVVVGGSIVGLGLIARAVGTRSHPGS
jgi:hypothetical protein